MQRNILTKLFTFGVKEVLNESRKRPLTLNVDSDATAEAGMPNTSRTIRVTTGY